MARAARKARAKSARPPRRSRRGTARSSSPSPDVLEVVLATHNPAKVREMLELVRDLPLRVYALDAFPQIADLPEDGLTYTENAISKALTVARLTRRVTIADDSGIEIDALHGAPGPQSRRFLGDGASDAQRNVRILKMVAGVAPPARTARYRAVVAVATPDGTVRTFEGTCEGELATAPRGAHGFGYDPIFVVPAYGKTMAQLPPAVKNRISHRARAVTAARPYVRQLAEALHHRTATPEPSF
ncbi:MAG TPA: RdgB/HAM1 family non-canonical purine NTP pyrophosphatase [bacterium]